MALRLIEMMTGTRNTMRDLVIAQFVDETPILGVLPFINVEGNGYSFLQEDVLPGMAFRGFNEGTEESAGVIQDQTETLTLFDGDVDIDRMLLNVNRERHNAHLQLKMKGAARRWQKSFLKGDRSGTNGREFNGLQARLIGSQIEYSGLPTDSAGTAASIFKLLETKRLVDNPTHWLMNQTMVNRLTIAAHNINVGGYITRAQDEFGRMQTVFDGLPILEVKYDENGNEILDFNEANPDGSVGTNTSIYCVNMSEVDGVVGIQGRVGATTDQDGEFGLQMMDLGNQTIYDSVSGTNKTVIRNRVEWRSSFAILTGRGAARLAGISNAAITQE